MVDPMVGSRVHWGSDSRNSKPKTEKEWGKTGFSGWSTPAWLGGFTHPVALLGQDRMGPWIDSRLDQHVLSHLSMLREFDASQGFFNTATSVSIPNERSLAVF